MDIVERIRRSAVATYSLATVTTAALLYSITVYPQREGSWSEKVEKQFLQQHNVAAQTISPANQLTKEERSFLERLREKGSDIADKFKQWSQEKNDPVPEQATPTTPPEELTKALTLDEQLNLITRNVQPAFVDVFAFSSMYSLATKIKVAHIHRNFVKHRDILAHNYQEVLTPEQQQLFTLESYLGMIGIESGYSSTAASPKSNAKSISQMIPRTWNNTVAKHKRELAARFPGRNLVRSQSSAIWKDADVGSYVGLLHIRDLMNIYGKKLSRVEGLPFDEALIALYHSGPSVLQKKGEGYIINTLRSARPLELSHHLIKYRMARDGLSKDIPPHRQPQNKPREYVQNLPAGDLAPL
ncbi:MAG: hypothetical protein H6502_03630 [Candidatus Woesearchaeota archaeon]|nr:MAG: hypothetical protein H6502_03630 [Candidatus Woesearchaeota archaeon]